MGALREELRRRVREGFLAWLADLDPGALGDPEAEDDYLDDYLSDELGISFHDAVPALAFDELGAGMEEILRGLPVVLLHHTASGALEGARSRGLVTRRDLGIMDYVHPRESQDAVFLTTEHAGPAVAGYQRRAVQRFGGHPVTLEVVVPFDELAPDSDDEDLGALALRQFSVSHVPAERIL